MDIVSYSCYTNGNIRLLLDKSNKTTDIESRLAQYLGRIKGVNSVFANESSGEIKIIYDHNVIQGKKLLRLLGYLGN
ncbi:MAG: hypothetical protein R3293_23075 [Candidatus Promineifilaceae bacterium]|nr:hypothetical protein [Candidatus Promineifilaceae bacterium]